MSQRKEKYLRESLERYDAIEREVAHLSKHFPAVVRDLDQVRLATANQSRLRKMDLAMTEAALKKSERRVKQMVRRQYKAERTANRAALLAIVIAAVALILAVKTATDTTAAEDAPQVTPTAAVNVIPLQDIITATTAPEATETPQDGPQARAVSVPYSDAVPMPREDQAALWAACEEFGIPYPLALAMVERETNFRPDVAGDSGRSIGYMQVQERYHRDRMQELGVTDLWDPAGNFRVGLDYLAELLATYEDTDKALMAYNMGQTDAGRLWKKGTYETEYTKAVQARAEEWAAILEE